MTPDVEQKCGSKGSPWHVAVLAAIMAFFALSTFRSSGYFYAVFMEEFQVDRGTASWPVCVLGTVIDMGGILAAPLSRRYSIPLVMTWGAVFASIGMLSSAFAPGITCITVTMGIVHGIGAGTLYTLLQVLLSMNFEKYRGTAPGIMYSGATLSALVGPQLLFFLRRTYNFRNSILLFGAILLHSIPISFLFRSSDCAKETKHLEKETKEMNVFSICETEAIKETPGSKKETAVPELPLLQVVQLVLRIPIYYAITLTWLIMCYNLDIFTTTLYDYAVDKGASATGAVSLISYASLTDLLGRILLPLLADRNYLRRSTLTACNLFMMGAAVTCFPVAASYGAFVGVAVAVSCFLGCAMSMCGVLLADNVGLDKLEVSYGLMGVICAPLLFLKPFFVGFFRDKLGTYDDMYHILGGLLLFLSLIWGIIVISERRASTLYVLRTKHLVIQKEIKKF